MKKHVHINPYYQPTVMSYAISEDVKPIIDVKEVPSCKLVERQYQLYSFGFVFWLNTSNCKLTTDEKQILTEFRLSRFNYRILFRHRKKAIEAVYSELLFVAKKLYKYYPQYQKWLADQERYKLGWLVNTEEYHSYMILNLPLEKLTIPKAIIQAIQKTKYRSLHEMLLHEEANLGWQKFIESPKDFKWFCDFAFIHGFKEFLGMSVTFQPRTKNNP